MVSHTVELFQKNFIDVGRNRDSREIVLYGLGRQTEEVLQAFPFFPIAGLLDGYREKGEIYGKEIIPLASLAGRNVKIVILARKASQKIIYRRIQNFCKEQEIPVFALDGSLMDRVRIGETDETYFRQSLDDLWEKVKSYDAVSFDIFDTLLTRKVPQPENVFQIVGARNGMPPEFVRMRMMAELALSESGAPTIFNIYQWIGAKMKISPEILRVLLEDEIAVEKIVLEPRQIMVCLLQEMISSGKKVYLVSDMYIPAAILEGILRLNGICGYDGLFVSCDYGTGKAGSLYEIYRNNSFGERRMHIGDSEELDGRAAQSHGIDTFLIRSPQDMAELTSMGRTLIQTGIATGVQGMIYARLYNNPFVLNNCGGKLQPEAYFDLGYGILGPILAGYVHWLCRQIRKEPLDVMLFIARDGYLVKKVFDMWKRVKGYEALPESVYLMTSRTFSMFASLQTQADILYASGLSFDGSAEEMLRKRFYLQEEDIMPRRLKEGDKEYIVRHAGLILSKAALARSAYQEYISGFHFKDKRIGIFDFVSTGTCQMCLEKIMGTAMQGYYFQRIADSEERKKALIIEDFMHANKPEYEYENYFLLEVWMKELCPSVRWVEANGNIQYYEQYYTLHQEEYIGEVHRGALGFCRDYLKVIEYGAEDFGIEKLALAILPFIDEEFIKMDLKQVKGYDTFCSRKIVFS